MGVAVVWFAREHPGWAVAIGGLLAVLFVGGLVLRHRMIEAERRRFLAANAELERVDRMTGRAFEHLVAERMIADGFRQVRERGGAGDGGVDITAVAPPDTAGSPSSASGTPRRSARPTCATSWARWPTPSPATKASWSPPAPSPARPGRRR
ncbi:hypothetical protein GCM10020001_102180 [Nonomuraea salmonea]